MRLSGGVKLQYKEKTGKGLSGSPVYFIEGDTDRAYVIALHVGGSKSVESDAAIPIEYHINQIGCEIADISTISGDAYSPNIFTFRHKAI